MAKVDSFVAESYIGMDAITEQVEDYILSVTDKYKGFQCRICKVLDFSPTIKGFGDPVYYGRVDIFPANEEVLIPHKDFIPDGYKLVSCEVRGGEV